MTGRLLGSVWVALLLCVCACGDGPSISEAVSAPTAPKTEMEPEPAADATAALRPAAGTVRIAAIGDVMLARDLVTLMDEYGPGYPYAAVADLLRSADITIANLEGTFTERGTAASKFYTFRTPPRHAIGLKGAGIDIVTLGNNHAMDFGVTGLGDTLVALDDAGILHAGAGLTETEARAPRVIHASGLRVAFLSFNGVSEATFADGENGGVAKATVGTIAHDVAAARTLADFVVVSLHAGTEYTDTPSVQQRELARAAIDSGAILVIGHHPHRLQGIERYEGGYIAYSLGNFVFDLDADDLATLGPGPFETAILIVTLSRSGPPDLSFEPILIDHVENRPLIPSPDRATAIRAKVERLNAALR